MFWTETIFHEMVTRRPLLYCTYQLKATLTLSFDFHTFNRSIVICSEIALFWSYDVKVAFFSNLPISPKKIFQKAILSLKFPPISVNNLFKFQAQDSFLEYFFWEIGRFEKRISLSEKSSWFTIELWIEKASHREAAIVIELQSYMSTLVVIEI